MKKILYFFALLFSIAFSAQDGILDTSFNIGTGADNSVVSIAYQQDGKILLGGNFTTYNNVTKKYLARINNDGTLDTSFGLVNDYLVGKVNTIVALPDGKTLIGGNSIFRLNANGTFDNTFTSGIVGSGTIREIDLQDDGKIIVVGDFSKRVARLNSNGTLDTTFNIGTGINLSAYSLKIQPDQKILVGGKFTSFNGVAINDMIRLNTDGTLDSTFSLQTQLDNPILDIQLQTDGKILICGRFIVSFNSRNYRSLARLNSTGSFDTTFTTNIDGGGVGSINIQPDKKIILGGGFYRINDIGKSGIARVYENGTVDQSFQSGSGVINDEFQLVSIILRQPDGKLLVGGNFNNYNGVARNNIIRINNPSLSTIELLRNKELSIYPNPVKDILNIKTDEPISGYEIYSLDGRKLTTENKANDSKINVSNLSKGNYIIKIKSKTKEQTTKFIKE